MKIDFVTKNKKVGSEKSVFFVEWLLFTGEDKIFRIEDKMKWAMMIHLINEVVNDLVQVFDPNANDPMN